MLVITHRRLLAFIFALTAILLLPSVSLAATLDLSPVRTTVHVGDSFTTTVLVSSTDQSLNAVSGSLSFPPDLLQVSSVSNANSVLTLWVEQPTYSNVLGRINWIGIVPNPGYAGSSGQVILVRFVAKRAGTATLAFTASSVLANDGSGTNILTASNPAVVSISAASAPPPAPSSQNPTTTKAPETLEPQVIFVKELAQDIPSGILVFWAVMPIWLQKSILICIGLATVVLTLLILGFGIVALVWILSRVRRQLFILPHLSARTYKSVVQKTVRFLGIAEEELKGDMDYSMRRLAEEVRGAPNTPSFNALVTKYLFLLREIAKRFTTRENQKTQAIMGVGVEPTPEERGTAQ